MAMFPPRLAGKEKYLRRKAAINAETKWGRCQCATCHKIQYWSRPKADEDPVYVCCGKPMVEVKDGAN